MSDIKTNTFLSHDWKDRVTELFFSCYLLLFQSETQITRLARNSRSTRNWWSVKYIFIMSRMQITYKGWRSKERKMFWLKKKKRLKISCVARKLSYWPRLAGLSRMGSYTPFVWLGIRPYTCISPNYTKLLSFCDRQGWVSSHPDGRAILGS